MYTIFFICPTILGAYYSLTDWDGMSPKYNIIGLKNYQDIFKDPRLISDLMFTFYYTFLVVIFIITLSLCLALILNSKIKFKSFFKSLYFFPAVLSLITVGLIWNEIYDIALPLVGKALGIQAISANILGDPKLAIYGILVTNIWQGLAIPTVIFIAGLQSIPNVLYEAATIDGATEFQRFKSITIPFLIPILNINLVLAIKGGLTVFDYIRAMTDGGPGYVTESIGLLIYRSGFEQYKYGYGAAESIVLFLIIIIISIIQIKFLNKKEVGQA